MAPTISQALGFCEREENPSILAYTEIDFSDDWSEQRSRSASWRNSCPDKKTMVSTRWSSHLTSLSSSVIGAGTALTTRAKQLGVGESTQRAMSQLRKSVVEVSSWTEHSLRAAMPVAQHRFSEADINQFDEPEDEKECDEEEGTFEGGHLEPIERASDGKLKKLHSSRSWTQGCT